MGIGLKTRRGEAANDPSRAVAQVLAELLGGCLVCRSGFSGHDYALLATWVVPSKGDSCLAGFFQAIKDHQWAKLHEFQTWLGSADNLEAYAIRCSQRVTVAVVKTHFELLQGARLIYSEALPAEEALKLLETFAGLEWHPF